MAKLSDLTRVLRSKNAGVDQVTFDFIFKDKESYVDVVNSGLLSIESISGLLNVDAESVNNYMMLEAYNAIKFSVLRKAPSGSPGEHDIYGAQQCSPFVDVEVP